MADQKRLFLIDGMALLFRSYFAMLKANLTTKTGEPTGATYAFCTALERLLEAHKPDLIAVAWDTKEPTFRHEQFEDYKAHRPDFPEEMIPQLSRVKEIVQYYHIPCIEAPGYEADDIIGTLSRRAANEGYQVYCVTPDKDYYQLVNENVFVYKPARPGGDEQLIDINGVQEKFGVNPDQVIDVLALIGDTADNVPGVKGVGEKSAIPLIQEYGTVENLYEHLDEIDKKGLKKKLEEGRDSAILSKQLVTIHMDVPCEVSFQELHLDPPDIVKLVNIYRDLGFKTLMTRYSDSPEFLAASQNGDGTDDATQEETTLQTITTVEHDYRAIRTDTELADLVTHLNEGAILSFDLETDSLDWQYANILGFALSIKHGEAFYIPIANEEITTSNADGSLFETSTTKAATEGMSLQQVLAALKPVLENTKLPKTGQNAKYDMLILRRHDIRVAPLVFDSMLASYILDSTKSHGMDALSERFLNYKPVSITELIGQRGKDQLNMRDVELEQVVEYACEDADITLQLHDVLKKELENEKILQVGTDYEFPLVEVLTEVEHCGVLVDRETLKEISVSLGETIARLEEEIYVAAGRKFTIGSPKQLAEILFDELGLPTQKKTKTGYSTDQFVMEDLAGLHPLPEKILEYRQASKLKSTYVDALPQLINPNTGRIHTSYNQAVAATGRLSSNNPNLQNIPIRSEIGREIRKAFVPGFNNGVLVSADYSQVELRIMAYICGDAALIQAFKDDFDIHTATAMNVFGVTKAEDVEPNMRRKAKEVNFGIMYGIGAFGLARRLKIDRSEAKQLIDTYFEKYPGVQEYITTTIEKAKELGYVETLSGRRRYFKKIADKNAAVRAGEERAAINMPIQGTASDIIKRAMIDIHSDLHKEFPDANMLLQVHDELVFEVPETKANELAAFVKEKMENAFSLDEVKLLVETGIGGNWFEAH